jgi:hypothetical protein
VLYNDEKTGPFAPAAYSMLMMGWTEGKSYSALEMSQMLDRAGFKEIRSHPTFGYYSIVSGIKP